MGSREEFEGSLRVLVGTADPDLALLVASTLEIHGHHVLVAPDARAAFGVLLEEPLDAVVVDTVVGDIAGLDVARAVRRSPRADRILTVLLARDVDGMRLALDDEGIEVLGKPPDALTLGHHLCRHALDRDPS